MIVLKTALKRKFLDSKSALDRARRFKTAQNLFVVMRLCSPVVFSYLNADFEPPCGRKDFWTACLLLLLLLALLAIKTRTRTELGPSLA